MKKQTVFSVLLIFLFAALLFTAGLYITERGLQEVSGRQETPGALHLKRGEDDSWVLIFAGRTWQLPLGQ
ncbi:hypothetical protein [Dethiobacter alkaliphilus]|uniref:Uncharacterized protein n=1 Tax=Dethiobacter alkaliphilus AHT 1 TaxID=555088 RepID=C0GEM5_DETAL|nr:hypothetical protein [Dethiobacter alkaliphilus]EEG78057.1 hypothetical protein DealDRAFT_0934 [Dethiobacter alkaliphilus AHT 1]